MKKKLKKKKKEKKKNDNWKKDWKKTLKILNEQKNKMTFFCFVFLFVINIF